MKLLAIESSCDETAAAVVENGRRVLSSVINSQVEEHRQYGGVVPEIASRRHTENIIAVTQKALDDAAARSQAASARADELEEQLDALMEESAQTALAYEQRAQEDAQTIETLAAQAESLSQAEAGQGIAPSAAPSLTLPPMPTARPLYTIPMPEK